MVTATAEISQNCPSGTECLTLSIAPQAQTYKGKVLEQRKSSFLPVNFQWLEEGKRQSIDKPTGGARSGCAGTSFVHRTAQTLGPEYASLRKPPYEGQVLTVVGFRRRLKSNVVVRDPNGNLSLMPSYMAEKAMTLPMETDSLQTEEETDEHFFQSQTNADGLLQSGLDSRKDAGMTYQEKERRLRDRLRNAAWLRREIQGLQSAFWDEEDALMNLADCELNLGELHDILDDIALAEDELDEVIEHHLDKLLRQPKSARGERSRRMWLRE